MAAPLLQNLEPLSGDSDRHPASPVYLEIVDAALGVAAASVILQVNGIVAWSGDAQQNYFSVTKSVITDGFSYRIRPRASFKRGGGVYVKVYAEDTSANALDTSYAFTLGTTRLLAKRDDFNNGRVDSATSSGNGIITEPAGTELKLDCPDNVQCNWYTSVANAPIAYYSIDQEVIDRRTGVFMAECRLSDYAATTANIIIGLTVFNDTQNAYHLGFDERTDDIRAWRGILNTWSQIYDGPAVSKPNTTPHRYRIIWNPGLKDFYLDDFGSVLDAGDITFCYSADDGATWVRGYTQALGLAFWGKFGVFLKKWDATTVNAQAYFDYLEFWEIAPPIEVELSDEPLADYPGPTTFGEDEKTLPSQLGPPAHQAPGVSQGLRAPGPINQPLGSIGPFDPVLGADAVQFPSEPGPTQHGALQQPRGILMDAGFSPDSPHSVGRVGLGEDEAPYARSGVADYGMLTTDTGGRPHLLGSMARLAEVYDTSGELWTTPTDPSFTGYGKDGHEYIAGVQQPAGPHAPWALEGSGADRSAVANFPDKVFVVVSQRNTSALAPNAINTEVVIFDLDNFPTSLDVWMRFKFNTANNAFFMVGNENRQVQSISMRNGVLVLGTIQGSSVGWLHLIDFKARGQDCVHLIGSTTHYKAGVGITIATRNSLTGYTATGVSPSLRINPEYVYSTDVLAEGAKTWVAVGGEDPPHQVFLLENEIPQLVLSGSGPAEGEANIGNARQAHFDDQGWLWYSVDKYLHRSALSWREGVIPYPETDWISGSSVRNRVELPHTIFRITSTRNELFCTTSVGVYKVDRGTMDAYLIYTLPGGGGRGALDAPGSGEKIPGENERVWMAQPFSLNLSDYALICTDALRAEGGSVLVRSFDDWVLASLTFPTLIEPGAWFSLFVKN